MRSGKHGRGTSPLPCLKSQSERSIASVSAPLRRGRFAFRGWPIPPQADPCVRAAAVALRTSGFRVGQRPVGESLSLNELAPSV